MNLFSDYQDKIYKTLKNLEKKKKIKIPKNIKNFNIEIPPSNQSGDISCNAAMILAKPNNISPIILADKLKKYFT